MGIRVGHIMRNEDVHGVSGTGKVADVFEATNGKCIVVWISAHSSVNVYDHIKDVETTHSHGGKTLVVWDYESPQDPDPMERVLQKNSAPVDEDRVVEIAAKAIKLAERLGERERTEEEEEKTKSPAKKGAEKKEKPTGNKTPAAKKKP